MPEPTPNPAQPPRQQYHIIGADGNTYGPADLNGLLLWISQGQVHSQTMVRHADSEQWQPAMALPELAGRFGPAMPQMAQAPVDPKKEALAKKLVIASHILGYGGLVMMIGGCVLSAATKGGTLGIVVVVLGLVGAIVGAIIGQVGRGMLGRAI